MIKNCDKSNFKLLLFLLVMKLWCKISFYHVLSVIRIIIIRPFEK